MDPLSSLSDLPQIAAGCVRDCDRARRDLVHIGAAALQRSDGSVTTLPWLGPVQLTWRYYLAWEHQHILLSFWRRPKKIDVALDSTLRFVVEPSPVPFPTLPTTDGPSASPAPPLSRLSWPRFLGPSSFDLAVFHLEHRPPSRRLELPISKDTIDFKSARLFRGDQTVPIRKGNRLLLEPLVDWIQTVGAWLRAPDANSSWRPLVAPGSGESLPARRILAAVVETYQQACQAGASSLSAPAPLAIDSTANPAPSPSGAVDWMPHCQTISEFSGTTWLRLKPDGTAIAEKSTDETTTLEMRYTLAQDDRRDRLEVRLQPPDFLLSGDLHRRILDTVAQAAIDADWHKRKGHLGRDSGVSEQEVRDLFSHADATVMRIQRKRDRDLDLILIHGPLQGSQVWVVLTAWLAVGKASDSNHPETRTLRVSSPPKANQGHGASDLNNAFNKGNDALNCIFVGDRFSDDPDISDDILVSFGRLMLALHRWGGIWPPSATPSIP